MMAKQEIDKKKKIFLKKLTYFQLEKLIFESSAMRSS